MEPGSPPRDILGLAPYGEALKIVAEGIVNGAGAFFGRLTLPASEEIGLALRDRVTGWRATNALKIAARVQERLVSNGNGSAEIHLSREFAYRAFDWATWCEHERLQDMWAGLIAASCSTTLHAETDMLCASLLSRLTPRQAVLLQWSASLTTLERDEEKALTTKCISHRAADIMSLFPGASEAEVGAEIHHLKTSGLFHSSGFNESSTVNSCVAVSLLGAMLYIRTQGLAVDVSAHFPIVEKQRKAK